MSDEIAIKIENLSKIYKIYDKPADRLKEALHPFRKRYSKDFYALTDISFALRRGETIGIIGENGSGKSTLLKMITGVLTPSSGLIEVDGNISALLELGAGFNPDFNGMENIFFYGNILGYTTKEIEAKLDEIVEFADIGEFIYQPVKMYSSGMFVRLAFALNACVEPEILIVDEALSVGDVFFQNKCYRKIKEIKSKDTAILFVSHDLGAVKSFCDRVLWLKKGQRIMFGGKEEVCAAYLNNQFKRTNLEQVNIVSNLKTKKIEDIPCNRKVKSIPKLTIENEYQAKLSDQVKTISFFITKNAEQVTKLEVDEDYIIHSFVQSKDNIDDLIVGFTIEDIKGNVVLANNTYIITKKNLSIHKGEVLETQFSFHLPKIAAGAYLISIAIAQGTQENHLILEWLHAVKKVEVVREGTNISFLDIDTNIRIIKYSHNQIQMN